MGAVCSAVEPAIDLEKFLIGGKFRVLSFLVFHSVYLPEVMLKVRSLLEPAKKALLY